MMGRELFLEETLALRDKERYHPSNPLAYAGSVGITDDKGITYCVGCNWCEGDWLEIHDVLLGKRQRDPYEAKKRFSRWFT